MKILAINGSINSNGSTAKLIDILLDFCAKLGAECEKVNLEDYLIEACKSCGKCLTNGECFQDDDYIQLKAKMLEADGIVIGSPYFRGEPAEKLKSFMDRMFLLNASSYPYYWKYFVGVSTSAKDNCKKVAKYCANLGSSKFSGNGIISGLLYESTLRGDNLIDFSKDLGIMERINKVGIKFIKDIKNNRVSGWYKLKTFIFCKMFRIRNNKTLRV